MCGDVLRTCDNYSTLFSDGRRVVGARALGRVARACSIVSCVAGRCCLLGSTPLSTIRSVCHMISTNQPIGRCATAKAADPSGRCQSGRRFVLQQRLTFITTSSRLMLVHCKLLTCSYVLPSKKKLSMIHLFEILSPVRRTREYCHASSHQLSFIVSPSVCQCSARCGSRGIRTREVRCSMERKLCNETSRPIESQECEGPPCDRRWSVSDWGPVSSALYCTHHTLTLSITVSKPETVKFGHFDDLTVCL